MAEPSSSEETEKSDSETISKPVTLEISNEFDVENTGAEYGGCAQVLKGTSSGDSDSTSKIETRCSTDTASIAIEDDATISQASCKNLIDTDVASPAGVMLPSRKQRKQEAKGFNNISSITYHEIISRDYKTPLTKSEKLSILDKLLSKGRSSLSSLTLSLPGHASASKPLTLEATNTDSLSCLQTYINSVSNYSAGLDHLSLNITDEKLRSLARQYERGENVLVASDSGHDTSMSRYSRTTERRPERKRRKHCIEDMNRPKCKVTDSFMAFDENYREFRSRSCDSQRKTRLSKKEREREQIAASAELREENINLRKRVEQLELMNAKLEAKIRSQFLNSPRQSDETVKSYSERTPHESTSNPVSGDSSSLSSNPSGLNSKTSKTDT